MSLRRRRRLKAPAACKSLRACSTLAALQTRQTGGSVHHQLIQGSRPAACLHAKNVALVVQQTRDGGVRCTVGMVGYADDGKAGRCKERKRAKKATAKSPLWRALSRTEWAASGDAHRHKRVGGASKRPGSRYGASTATSTEIADGGSSASCRAG
ncbi:MAG: hypothetical protein ACLR9W_02700 [Enterobacter hormaechei]